MSLNNVPNKAEVMGWGPKSLADYMRKLKLSGCDKVVMKNGISGAQFTEMTEYDLQVFPSLYVSIITKIHSDMNKGEQKKGFGHKLKMPMYPKQVPLPTAFVQEEEVWDSDDFDDDSDYEAPPEEVEEGDESYICTLDEQQRAEEQGSDREEYDMPPPEDTIRPPRHPRMAKLQDSHNRDPVPDPPSAGRASKPPPQPPRINHTLPKPFKLPASQPKVPIDRSRKPVPPGPPPKESKTSSLKKSKGSGVKASSSFSKILPSRGSKSSDASNRESKAVPTPPIPTQPAMVKNPIPGPRGDLDPSWYGGNLTRHLAEVALREVNKDGAFIVRDSSRGLGEHPYTLMLLKQGRVYNIKIRKQGHSYSLGTGLNSTKSFPGVKEMITHHTHTPLLLIDGTDQGSEAQSHSRLLHPAGL